MAYWCDDQGLNLAQRRLDAQQTEAAARMRQYEFHDYSTGEDGETKTAVVTTERFIADSGARAHAGRLAKKGKGPVDMALAGGAPWADRYITTANPSEHHTAGFRFERLT